ncbi:nucleotidyltransferase family protein [Candidatus Palauibacter sp.]|uniref:nucleotidyltransferase family protein n=1 Tax=Candidatus Palauibacter sp. TaxID=3101350 RepID=UPI003B58F69B
MEAMIFAAGKGRRLRPLTDTTPKALIDFGGVPLMERVAGNLVAAGAHRVIVNAHHLAHQVAEWAAASPLGVPVAVSREDEVSPAPLDTSGGLFHAGPLFEAEAPFLLHNCDVATAVDLAALYHAHVEGAARDGRLATLVVAERATTRPLLVDGDGVVGRANRTEGWEVIARAPSRAGETGAYGFCGIHVLSERVFERSAEGGTFSIMDSYMDWIGDGERVGVFDATGTPWYDIGTPERLAAARRAFAAGSATGATPSGGSAGA